MQKSPSGKGKHPHLHPAAQRRMSEDEIHEEIRREAQYAIYERRPLSPTAKKVIACIVIFLLLVFYIFGTAISDVFHSLLLSRTVTEDAVYVQGLSLQFKPEILGELQDVYHANPTREIRACFSGNITGSTYYVDKIFYPEVISADLIHILTPPCPSFAIVDLHSHPVNRCIPSPQDLVALRDQQQKNPRLIMAVMCSPTRFYITG